MLEMCQDSWVKAAQWEVREGEQKGKIKATDFPGKLCFAEKSLEENAILININLNPFFFFFLI